MSTTDRNRRLQAAQRLLQLAGRPLEQVLAPPEAGSVALWPSLPFPDQLHVLAVTGQDVPSDWQNLSPEEWLAVLGPYPAYAARCLDWVTFPADLLQELYEKHPNIQAEAEGAPPAVG